MKAYTISSIQQIGVGTKDFKASWEWYIKMFGFDVKILEDDTVAERMLPYTGGVPQKRHACVAVNLQGGGGLEIWQYSERKPVDSPFEPVPGDLGIFAAKLKCRNIYKFHEKVAKLWTNMTPLSCDPSGTLNFFIRDPYGNVFQILQDSSVFIDDGKLCGGIAGAIVGVSDIERSKRFYQEILGYDNIIYDKTGPAFQNLIALQEQRGEALTEPQSCQPQSPTQTFRRVLLGKSETPTGAFSGLLGNNTIELVQALDRVPKKIYEGRYWGDPGFIQICYDVTGTDALGEFCKSKGHPFTVDSCPDGERFDMGEASGRFTYIEDPDGTLIEFVETRKVPLVAKLGLYIDLEKRGIGKRPQAAAKPLPKLLFRIMGLVSRKH